MSTAMKPEDIDFGIRNDRGSTKEMKPIIEKGPGIDG